MFETNGVVCSDSPMGNHGLSKSKGFWLSKDAGCMSDGEVTFEESSRMEPKRVLQWFPECSEGELFPNKKQAVEVPSNSSFPAISSLGLRSWGNVSSSFHSVPDQFTQQLLDCETAGAFNFEERNIESLGPGNLSMARKDIDNPFLHSSFNLSGPHALEDAGPGLNYGGIRKVKVCQVKDSENVMSLPMMAASVQGDGNNMTLMHDFNKLDDACSLPMGLGYSRGEHDVMTSEADNFISMNLPYTSKGDHSISAGHNYKDESNTISLVEALCKGDSSLISISPRFSKQDNSDDTSRDHAFSTMGDESLLSVSQGYNKENDTSSFLIGDGSCYSKGGEDGHSVSICYPNHNSSGSSLSMGHCFAKGQSNIISFGAFSNDENVITSENLIIGQPSVQRPGSLTHKDLAMSDSSSLLTASLVSTSGLESASKKKDDLKLLKKTPSNNFPSNVRSLLSTGIFDGVPVKYMAWSKEKQLHGIIRGTGYLCGCQSCNMNKVINAFEFERHAGCKTKHPNNHIYFDNGKTIYGTVLELRSTPQNMLFDVIQTITGSHINQKSFRLWKESFLAATRELQRIYGKDEFQQPT